MIRVMNIISDTNIGGAGRVILNYLRYADRSRFETWVAVPRGSLLVPPLEEAGARVFQVDGIADRSYSRADVRVLEELIRREKPDLVHTHGALSGRIAARRCHVPVVYSRHSAFPVPAKLRYPPGRWVNKLVNEHYADRIIAVSPATAENLTDGGISPKKITIVMNGVAPLKPASPEEHAAGLRQLAEWGRLTDMDILLLSDLPALPTPVSGVHPLPPLPPLETLSLLCACRCLLTDSDSLQREAFYAGKRALVPSAAGAGQLALPLESGWHRTTPLHDPAALAELTSALSEPCPHPGLPEGSGRAVRRMVAAVMATLADRADGLL